MGSLSRSASGRVSSEVRPGWPGFYPVLSMNTSKDEECTAPLGNLFQFMTVLMVNKFCFVSTVNLLLWCMYIDAPLHLLGGFSLHVGRRLLGPSKSSLLWAEQARLLQQVGHFCTGVSLSGMRNCSD